MDGDHRASVLQKFDNMVKKIGQMINDNQREEIAIYLLEQEIEERKREIEEFKVKQESFALVEHELNLIRNICSEEEAKFLQRKQQEKENIKYVAEEKEQELEDKKQSLIDAEKEIKEMQVRIEENQLKEKALQKKIDLKTEKIEKILIDIEIENKALKELNEAVLQRAEDMMIIKAHEELVMQRDAKAKDLAKVTEKQTSMQDKLSQIKHMIEKIGEDLKEARRTKDQKLEELQLMRKKGQDMGKYQEGLITELSELEVLESEITFLNYYISKAELKLMQYKKAHREKNDAAWKNSKLRELQQELMSLPTNSYTHTAKDRIDNSVKSIIDKINFINPK
jgi:chromosome segregation ATPase